MTSATLYASEDEDEDEPIFRFFGSTGENVSSTGENVVNIFTVNM